MSTATTRHGRLPVGWGSWGSPKGKGRDLRRRRSEAMRRLESLEDRRLLAASIAIDAVGGLDYTTETAAEELTISVSGNVYTFSSDQTIDLTSNLAGLTVTGSGTNLVTVTGPAGIDVWVEGSNSSVNIESTDVSMWVEARPAVTDTVVTLGVDGDLSGIGDAIGVATTSSDLLSVLVDGSAGTAGGDWLLAVDSGFSTLTGFGDGGKLFFVTSDVSSLSLNNAVGQDDKLTVDFSGGNPLPTVFNYDGGWASGGSTQSNLVLLDGVTFDSESYLPTSESDGSIVFEQGLSDTFTIEYSGISPTSIYDTVSSTFFVFSDPSDPTVGLLVSAGANSADTGNLQTLKLSSVGSTPQFTEIHIANKQNVNIYQDATDDGYSLTIDYNLTDPVVGLLTLSPTQSDGPDTATLTSLPPDATVIVLQEGGDDTMNIYVPGTGEALMIVVDGGDGTDAVVLDADGLAISPANFFGPILGGVFVTGSPLPGASISIVDYESITVENLPDIEPTVTLVEPINAVQGVPLIDVLVGTFTASATTNASIFGATIDWGDGSITTAGTIVQDASNPTVYYVYGTHTYTGADSPLTTVLTVRTLPVAYETVVNDVPITFETRASVDSDEGVATITATTLDALTPTVYGVPIHGVEGQALINTLVGAFTSSATATASDFVATIDWGDGSIPTAGTIVQDAGNPSVYYIYGSHTYYVPGQGLGTTITVAGLATSFQQLVDGSPVTFFRPAGEAESEESQAFIDDAPINVSVGAFTGFENIAIAAADVVVGTFTDLGGVDPTAVDPASAYTATIYWGDGTAGVGAISIQRIGTTTQFVVTAAPHTYAIPGSYPVTVVVAQPGETGVGIGVGSATIADAPLNQTPSQPTIADATEGVRIVDAVLTSFVDANPLATTDQYTVTVDWGDGTGLQAARVVQPDGVGTTFYVVASHTYASAIPNGGVPTIFGPGVGPHAALSSSGNYAINVSVRDTYGSAVNLFNTITVLDQALTVGGALASSSDTGISNTDGITNDSTPTFTGTTSEGNATVWIYASLNGGAATALGSTVSDASGAWSFTPAAALADGGYVIQAQAYDAGGHTISPATTIASALVVDTVGPKVTDVIFDNVRGQVIVSFQDYGGASNVGVGLVGTTIRDANNYRFAKSSQPLRRWQATSITVDPGTTTGEQVATVQFNGGVGIRGGRYAFQVLSVAPSNLSGVQDLAGNALDGEFYSYFPSGNNVNGGDFTANLDAIHRTILPASSRVGTATPVTPPGRAATGRTIGRGGVLLPSAASAVRLSTARQTLVAARAARVAALSR